MQKYPPQIYRVLQALNDCEEIPDSLHPVVALCEREGLVRYAPVFGGQPERGVCPELSDVGEAVLLLHRENVEPEPTAESDWPTQAEVARMLGWDNPKKPQVGKQRVYRLTKDGTLRKDAKGRIDPASITAYCRAQGITYGEP